VGVGVVEELAGDRCEPYVERALDSFAGVLRGLGARVTPVSLPLLRRASDVHNTIQMAEAAAVHGPALGEVTAGCAPDVRERLAAGGLLPAAAVLTAARARRLLVEEAYAAMERARLDVLLAPTAPTMAPRRDAETVKVRRRQVPLRAALTSLVLPLSQLPGPALALPAGQHDELPLGVQLAARPHAEDLVLRVGGAYEAATA
jgi:aspartyl-tRNA(Asn)/glutamyl-tRNA(Gln) amidotransferase subunit A